MSKISPSEAKKMMDMPDTVILDVRREDEFRAMRVIGAVNIPLDALEERAGDMLPDADAAILIYCRSGSRSARADAALAGLGYTRVYDFGGIIDWPYDVEKGG